MARYKVEKCICHNRSFKELKAYAKENDIEQVEELQARNMCSCGCRMCMPYVELMLQTGETAFEPGAPHKRKRSKDS